MSSYREVKLSFRYSISERLMLLTLCLLCRIYCMLNNTVYERVCVLNVLC